MIKIHISFWLAAVVFYIMGLGYDFLMVTIAVTAHEFTHVLVAKLFGCKIGEMRISALGEMAYIKNLNRLGQKKRALIITAGPACNLLLWLVSWQAGMELFAFYNLVLCFFNLLPIFPLDGAKLLQICACNKIGILRANRLIIKTGNFFCIILIMLGIVQAVLYAPNFTMLLVGFSLLKKGKDTQIDLMGEFYMVMLNKQTLKNLPSKVICAYSYQTLNYIINSLGWDWTAIISVTDHENVVISEDKIIGHVLQHGLGGTLADCL